MNQEAKENLVEAHNELLTLEKVLHQLEIAFKIDLLLKTVIPNNLPVTLYKDLVDFGYTIIWSPKSVTVLK